MSKKKGIISKSEMVAIKNAVTNEMETAKVTMIVQRDTPKYKGEPFTMLFQAVNKVIARNITPATAKVLLFICSEVNYGNVIGKGVKQIAEELQYSERQVLRAMKELEILKVIFKSKNAQDGRITMYNINPTQSWKGTVKDRSKAISGYNKNQLTIFDDKPAEDKKKLVDNTTFLEQTNEHSLLS